VADPLRRTLTKNDLVDSIFRKVDGIQRRQLAQFVDVFFETMKESLERGETVKLATFGSFIPRDKKARVGRNPHTGERLMVSERRVLLFRVSKVLRDALNR
jgi:integration host factor subunit alpha